MKDISIKELKNTATQMRMKVIDMIYKAQSGHPGGSLSAAEFVTACYFKYMDIDPKDPRWPDRDRYGALQGPCVPRPVRLPGHAVAFSLSRSSGHPAQGGLDAPGPPRR